MSVCGRCWTDFWRWSIIKSQSIYWKYWNCFENLEFLIAPVNRATLGKDLETAVLTWQAQEVQLCSCGWTQVCPHSSSCRGCGPVRLSWAPLGTEQAPARAPQCWGIFAFCFAPWLCERRNRKNKPLFKLAHQTLLDKPWTPVLERGFSSTPELQAPEKIKCFLFSAS